jgi:hypothetical protein
MVALVKGETKIRSGGNQGKRVEIRERERHTHTHTHTHTETEREREVKRINEQKSCPAVSFIISTCLSVVLSIYLLNCFPLVEMCI